MTTYSTTRAGFILAARNVFSLSQFYVDAFQFEMAAKFEEPPYVILVKAGMRLSLTEDGTTGADLPDFTFRVGQIQRQHAACMVLEVTNCDAARADLEARGVTMRSETYRPPWGGARFFCEDPEHNLIEVEELA